VAPKVVTYYLFNSGYCDVINC